MEWLVTRFLAKHKTLILDLRPVLHSWNGFGPTRVTEAIQYEVASTCSFSSQNDKMIHPEM
jgi:hypothetical protein